MWALMKLFLFEMLWRSVVNPLYLLQIFFFSAKSVCHCLIKSLIPADCVAESSVLKVISWICTNVPQIDTQVDIACWLLKASITFVICSLIWLNSCLLEFIGNWLTQVMPKLSQWLVNTPTRIDWAIVLRNVCPGDSMVTVLKAVGK